MLGRANKSAPLNWPFCENWILNGVLCWCGDFRSANVSVFSVVRTSDKRKYKMSNVKLIRHTYLIELRKKLCGAPISVLISPFGIHLSLSVSVLSKLKLLSFDFVTQQNFPLFVAAEIQNTRLDRVSRCAVGFEHMRYVKWNHSLRNITSSVWHKQYAQFTEVH